MVPSKLLDISALVLLASSISSCVVQEHQQAPPTKPPLNFVFLLVDDWGWRDAGCLGSDLYETPNIDKLAADGVRFTNTYAACTVCSPTRAAVLTGMYPGRTHVTDWIPGHQRKGSQLRGPAWTQRLEHKHITIAEALRESGYRTAHIGKWHLTPRSSDPAVVAPFYPERHGFEINVAGNQWGAPGSYHWPFRRRQGKNLGARVANFPAGGKKGDYLTDTLTDQAEKVLDQFKDQPFLLYFPYYNVHTPIQGRKDLTKRYQQKLSDGKQRQHRNAAYAAMVTAVDESLGRIRSKLTELGIADRTVIVLTGDNGGLDRGKRGPTDNAPLRAGKGSAYEGGVRVPGVVLWPGGGNRGGICEEPIISVDFYPTILSLAGQDSSDDAIDGESLVPLLKDPAGQLQRDAIFWHYPHYHPGGAKPYGAIRSGDWRLVEFFEDMRIELYNLAKDPAEASDLAKQNPAKANALRKQLHTWRTSVQAQLPSANPDYKPTKKKTD
jgi:arylsulfatase A